MTAMMGPNHWSAATLAKAEGLLETPEALSQDTEQPTVWWISGGRPEKPYRVQTDGEHFITCSCPNGLQSSRPRCYHSAAVMLKIGAEI